MSTTLPAAEVFDPAFAPVAHPTLCPPWCADRSHPANHHFGPSMTAHFSPQQRLSAAGAVESLLRVELMRTDERDDRGETMMYVQGAADVELSRDEADLFIADFEAMLAKLKVQRRQMDA